MTRQDSKTLKSDEQLFNSNHASLFTTLNRVIRETEDGGCPDELHADLESEVRIMFLHLRRYRDHDAVVKIWEEFGLDQIPHLCARREEVQVGGVGHLGIDTSRVETRIIRAPVDYLIEWGLAFNEILMKLDLTMPVKDGKGDLFLIRRDPEDYPEPVKDDIPKPE